MNAVPIYIESAPYTSASQLAGMLTALRSDNTMHTGVPNSVKKSGQQREEIAPIRFSST